MSTWKAGDIGIAVRNATCGCGGHAIEHRKIYRVRRVERELVGDYSMVWLDVGSGQDFHFYQHFNFRRETKADQDVFRLAGAPTPGGKVKAPQLEPAR